MGQAPALSITLLMAAALIAAGCREEAKSHSEAGVVDEIRLTGSNLRDFAASLAMPVEAVPNARLEIGEEWVTDVEDILYIPGGDGLLGFYSRPLITDLSSGSVGILNAVLVFEDSEHADATFESAKAGTSSETRGEFQDTSGAASVQEIIFKADAGEESWAEVLVADSGAVSAMIVFRYGPVIAITGMAGFASFDEGLMRELLDLFDVRIRERLAARDMTGQMASL